MVPYASVGLVEAAFAKPADRQWARQTFAARQPVDPLSTSPLPALSAAFRTFAAGVQEVAPAEQLVIRDGRAETSAVSGGPDTDDYSMGSDSPVKVVKHEAESTPAEGQEAPPSGAASAAACLAETQVGAPSSLLPVLSPPAAAKLDFDNIN